MTKPGNWESTSIHIVALAAAWVCLSALLGLFRSFEILETSREIVAASAFLAAARIATFWILIGGLILGVPLLLFARKSGYKLSKPKTNSQP